MSAALQCLRIKSNHKHKLSTAFLKHNIWRPCQSSMLSNFHYQIHTSYLTFGEYSKNVFHFKEFYSSATFYFKKVLLHNHIYNKLFNKSVSQNFEVAATVFIPRMWCSITFIAVPLLHKEGVTQVTCSYSRWCRICIQSVASWWFMGF
jgi:hypothetical protein